MARALLVVALAIGAPLSYARTTGSGVSLVECGGRQAICATVRHAEGRVAIVSARAAGSFSLNAAKRSSVWHGAVLAAAESALTADLSIFVASGDRVAPRIAARSSQPVRAPPLFV
jgi:hypothetical protein